MTSKMIDRILKEFLSRIHSEDYSSEWFVTEDTFKKALERMKQINDENCKMCMKAHDPERSEWEKDVESFYKITDKKNSKITKLKAENEKLKSRIRKDNEVFKTVEEELQVLKQKKVTKK